MFCILEQCLSNFYLFFPSGTVPLISSTARNTQNGFGKPQLQLPKPRIDTKLSKNRVLHSIVLGLSVRADA